MDEDCQLDETCVILNLKTRWKILQLIHIYLSWSHASNPAYKSEWCRHLAKILFSMSRWSLCRDNPPASIWENVESYIRFMYQKLASEVLDVHGRSDTREEHLGSPSSRTAVLQCLLMHSLYSLKSTDAIYTARQITGDLINVAIAPGCPCRAPCITCTRTCLHACMSYHCATSRQMNPTKISVHHLVFIKGRMIFFTSNAVCLHQDGS